VHAANLLRKQRDLLEQRGMHDDRRLRLGHVPDRRPDLRLDLRECIAERRAAL
jgi:hypothetical protein